MTADALYDAWPYTPRLDYFYRHRLGRRLLGLFGRRYIRKPIEGFEMLLDLRDNGGVSKYILKYGNYDPFLSRMVRAWVQGGDVIDVGANIGYYSLLASRATTGTVHAFEPDPDNFALLSENIRLNDRRNIKTWPLALGEQRDTLTLYKSARNFGDHQLYPGGEAREAVQVEVAPADEVLGGLDNLRLVKIDVQGFEPFVIGGMHKLLTANAQVKVISEFWPEGMARAGGDGDAYLDFFEQLGFRRYLIEHDQERFAELDRAAVRDLCAGNRQIDLLFAREAP